MSFSLLADHLPDDVSYTEKSGFYAEKDDSGHIRHFAYYENGKAVGWTLALDPEGLVARKVDEVISPHPDDPEDELTEDEVLGWVHRIAGLKGGTQVCSFCGKNNTEVAKLIAGPETYICNECVELCAEILSEEQELPEE